MSKKENAKDKRVNQQKRDHEFSEELSDGGIRNQVIKKQSTKSCGGL
ncbi:hypothetical protein [Salinibacillus xinjiangensis]|uniref:Uncharacterized protein n=1 Tax=Salinibacillus xinjiangensis TaxID=1229268 RepID=A0A6G1X9K6_9BACI|nr:hypothetical protein [Salinibacillus xinjiangensis]MRG87468.1 hypothetical protein [Salinibacillus xinjiangensis]